MKKNILILWCWNLITALSWSGACRNIRIRMWIRIRNPDLPAFGTVNPTWQHGCHLYDDRSSLLCKTKAFTYIDIHTLNDLSGNTFVQCPFVFLLVQSYMKSENDSDGIEHRQYAIGILVNFFVGGQIEPWVSKMSEKYLCLNIIKLL